MSEDERRGFERGLKVAENVANLVFGSKERAMAQSWIQQARDADRSVQELGRVHGGAATEGTR